MTMTIMQAPHRYHGGKNADGTYQTIINLIPPHTRYIEPFFGSGAIMRLKRPAEQSIGIELDPDVVSRFSIADFDYPIALICADGIQWLGCNPIGSDDFIYCDPPYVMSSRKCQRPLYDYEMTDADHRALLDILCTLPCNIMISGYDNAIYADRLSGWHKVTFEVVTRGGSIATETLWMNYAPPKALHDYGYVGDSFTKRQGLKRKADRWIAKFERRRDVGQHPIILQALEKTGLVDYGGPYVQYADFADTPAKRQQVDRLAKRQAASLDRMTPIEREYILWKLRESDALKSHQLRLFE